MFDPNEFIPRELGPDELVRTLFGFSARIAASRELDVQLELMNQLARQLVVCDRCSLWLVDSAKGEYWTKVAHGVKELRIPKGTGMISEAIEAGHPLIVPDAYADPHFNSEMDRNTGYTTRNALIVPIFRKDGKVLGAYQAINKLESAGEVFTHKDIERLQMAASFSGSSIESTLLVREIEKTQRELVHILGEVAESRSKETGRHVIRVGRYCRLLASEVIARGLFPSAGLKEEDLDIIELAAPLHDVGKVAIPDAILNKPGKLTPEERTDMERHAEIGWKFLIQSPRTILQVGAIIAYEHQEKFNGTGYPRRLAGRAEEVGPTGIHLYGRLCAVADVFDALVSKRCYKHAWPIEEVQKLFLAERGEHFDPDLVDILMDVWDQFIGIMEDLKDLDED
jgi:HD-GYP domain-containing protein (c-di-GMP phosphodiesterase class II)